MPDRAINTVKKLGRYDIVRVLGKGAMGVVYEARDPNLNRKVAIKTVRVDSLAKDEAIEYELRFRTQAHSAARLQHPNIVSVYDSDRDGDTPFLVMEFVKGDDLKHYLDSDQRYSLEQSVRMMRDLLLEADGRVKLTDFGVARIQDSGEATRTQGGMVGTLKYMSPEQVEGKTVDASSDLYSAGIVLYQLLTDRRPFDGDSYFSIVNQITNQHPPSPSSINQMLPTALDAVVSRALAKDKTQRFATAQDFSLALQAAARRADPTITPSANPYKIIEQHGTGSLERSGSTSSSTLGSTITQELELVYWKDVKESDDVVDLEGFLTRFPEGVYADLAKRRLKRMAQERAELGQDNYDQTLVAPLSGQPTEAEVLADYTLGISGLAKASLAAETTLPLVAAPVANAAMASQIESPAPANDLPAQVTPDTNIAPASSRSKKTGLWIGLIALVLGAAALWAWQSRPSNSMITESSLEAGLPALAASAAGANTSTVSVTPTLAAASEPIVTTTTATPVTTTVASTTGSVATATAAASISSTVTVAVEASTPTLTVAPLKPSASSARAIAAARLEAQREAQARASASAPTTAPQSSTSVPVSSAQPAASSPSAVSSAAASAASQPRPAPSNPRNAAAGPQDACEGRLLFGYGACLYEQCAKPAFFSHPYCVYQRDQQERAHNRN